jgi:hypothetical protein
MRTHPSANSAPVAGKGHGTLKPFLPGRSGNPTGRPRTGRTVSKALAAILDSSGVTPDEVIMNFRKTRGRWICGADHAAAALFLKATDAQTTSQVQAAALIMDRTEGKLEPAEAAKSSGNFTMNITIQALGGESLEGLPPSIKIKAVPEPLPALPAAIEERE